MEQQEKDALAAVADALTHHFPTAFNNILKERLTEEEFEKKMMELFAKVPKH